VYGLGELLVGSALVFVAFGKTVSGEEGALAAVGGVYVLVRAFESVWIGAMQPQERKAAREKQAGVREIRDEIPPQPKTTPTGT
jgi:hypothetical protein